MRRFCLACALVLGWAVLIAARPAHGQGLRVPLGADTATNLRFTGSERLRGESWTGFGNGAGSQAQAAADFEDQFGLSRLLLRGALNVRGRFQLVGEIKSSLASDRSLPGGIRTSDEDEIDLQQLYGRLSLPAGRGTFDLQAGRFDLSLGRERLVGPSDWTNTRRVFQGASVVIRRPDAALQLFWMRPIVVRRHTPNIADSSKQLYGLVGSRWRGREKAELYWLRLDNRSVSFNGTAGYEHLNTFGMRAVAVPAARAFDFDIEAAWQAGSIGSNLARAWMVGAVVGRTFGGTAAPRLYAGLDAASGDRSPGGSVQTFNQLFPTGHAFLGYVDAVGRQNVIAPNVGASLRAFGTTLQLDAYDFSRASTSDGLYAADGSLTRQAGTGFAAHIGNELDLTARRPVFGGRVALQAGAAWFWVGEFLRQSTIGPAVDARFLYAQATVAF